MKPLLVLGKVFLIGCLWSLFFIEGIRVILLINWHFDIFWAPHWAYLWDLWHSGWVINHAKEWAFILILLASVPMWLTGWIFLSVISWHKLFEFLILNPLHGVGSFISDVNAPIRNDLALKKVVKKKSYKEIRPNMQGVSATDPFENHPVSVAIKMDEPETGQPAPYAAAPSASQMRPARAIAAAQSTAKAAEEKKPFTHSVFDFDDDDDDFELDFDYAVKSIQAKQKEEDAQNKYDEEPADDDYDSAEESPRQSRKNQKNAKKSNEGFVFDDFESNIADEDYDDFDASRSGKSGKRRSRPDDFDDEFDFDRPQKNEDDRRARGSRDDNRRSRDNRDDRETKRERNERRSDNGRRDENNRHQDTERKNEPNRKNEAGNPIVDTLRQKGYEIISGVTIKNAYIDYIAVDANTISLCLVDKEVGDWLADEERFNDEEPLWFSETSHRVSPVRMVDIARNILAKKLKSCKITFDLRAFVIIQNGNIINAEDMFEVWRGIDVDVTRINRGSPKEIPLFSKSVEEVSRRIDSLRFESLKKLIRSID